MAGNGRRRNRRKREQTANDSKQRQRQRYAARSTDLAAAGKPVYAPLPIGLEAARLGTKVTSPHRQLCRRLRDPVPSEGGRGPSTDGKDDGEAEAGGEPAKDTHLSCARGIVRLPRIHAWTVLSG